MLTTVNRSYRALGCEITIVMRILGTYGLCSHATWSILPRYVHFLILLFVLLCFEYLFLLLAINWLLLAGLLQNPFS